MVMIHQKMCIIPVCDNNVSEDGYTEIFHKRSKRCWEGFEEESENFSKVAASTYFDLCCSGTDEPPLSTQMPAFECQGG